MARNLVLVESPAKAKTIEKYLGGDFRVLATYGHIKDLPERVLGVDVDRGFTPNYQLTAKSKKVVGEIKKAAKSAKDIYIASDPDREGEAIAVHVAEELIELNKPVRRVLFYEVTKNAILKAFEHPYELDLKKYDAQKSRRVLDRLVGYKISPLLWYKVKRGLSAGRVQSVALRLICEREKVIKDFVPVEYWVIKGIFENSDNRKVVAKLEEIKGKKPELGGKEQADAVLDALSKTGFYLKAKIEKPKKRSAGAPFITSTLQQEAVKRLRFTTKRTMMVAQILYEGVDLGEMGRQGIITYMRTDSPRVSKDAVDAVRSYISVRYGKEYLSDSPRQFAGKKSAQEAHECIRPTNVEFEPEKLKEYLTREQFSLYKMIYDRFVACQMAEALYNQTIYEIEDSTKKEYLFRARGMTLKFPGYLAAYREYDTEDEEGDAETVAGTENTEGSRLPILEENCGLKLAEPLPEQNFTSPLPRYTEATLVKELEEDGIGRPSTYATIISTLLEKDYTRITEGKFYPTELGCTVSDLLVKGFPDIINVDFTAGMEGRLDEVEEGKLPWAKLIEEFYNKFTVSLEHARNSMENLKRKGIETDKVCERCGKPMVIKTSGKNEFLACSGYPQCKNIKNFQKDKTGRIEIVATSEKTDKICPKCGGSLLVKRGPYSNFLGCEKYPACRYTEAIKTDIPCPKCGTGFIVERRTKKARLFYGCSAYPDCNFISNYRLVNEKCPQCGSAYLVEAVEKRTPMIKCPVKECGFKKPK